MPVATRVVRRTAWGVGAVPVAAARRFAGEAHLSGWIIVRSEPGALTAAERNEFAVGLDCLHVGVTEDGLEC